MKQSQSGSKIFRLAAVMLIMLLFIFSTSFTKPQNSKSVQYIYDEKGRLKFVIVPPCNKTLYEYDSNGNTTKITPMGTGLIITSYSPNQGVAGDIIVFNGVGFNPDIKKDSVIFNKDTNQQSVAQVVAATTTQLTALVPDGLLAGNNSITVISDPCGKVVLDFNSPQIPGQQATISVAPQNVQLSPNGTVQFQATVTGLTDTSVTWTATGGTIDVVTGFFTAPNTTFGPPITVRATSNVLPSLFAEATVTVLGGS